MPGPLRLSVDPDSVSVPPDAEVTASVRGGVPPYVLDSITAPPGITVQIQGSGPTWSVIISGSGSGNVTLEAQDSSGDADSADVQVN